MLPHASLSPMAVCGPELSSPTGSRRPAAAQRTIRRESQAPGRVDRRASTACAPWMVGKRWEAPSTVLHDPESEAGPVFHVATCGEWT